MSDLILPPGKAAGCLPRISEPGEWCPLAKERIDIVPEADWPEFMDDIDLRLHVNRIKDQDGDGSCACESSTLGVEVARDIMGWEFARLNPLFVYHTTCHGRDGGSSIDENLRFIRERGIAPESAWPRSKGWRAEPTDEAYEAARDFRIMEFYDITNRRELVSALLLGFPVVFGWQGHSVLFTSVKDMERGVYANSWGTAWGDSGFGVLPFSEVNYSYGAFAVRLARFNRELPTIATAA